MTTPAEPLSDEELTEMRDEAGSPPYRDRWDRLLDEHAWLTARVAELEEQLQNQTCCKRCLRD